MSTVLPEWGDSYDDEQWLNDAVPYGTPFSTGYTPANDVYTDVVPYYDTAEAQRQRSLFHAAVFHPEPTEDWSTVSYDQLEDRIHQHILSMNVPISGDEYRVITNDVYAARPLMPL